MFATASKIPWSNQSVFVAKFILTFSSLSITSWYKWINNPKSFKVMLHSKCNPTYGKGKYVWKFYIYFSHFILLGHELNTSCALRIKVTGNQGSLCNLCGFPLAFSCVNTKRLILSHCSSACPCSRPFIWEFSISIIFSGGNNEWHSRSRWVIILQKNHITFLCI